jgi:hypothetical protein
VAFNGDDYVTAEADAQFSGGDLRVFLPAFESWLLGLGGPATWSPMTSFHGRGTIAGSSVADASPDGRAWSCGLRVGGVEVRGIRICKDETVATTSPAQPVLVHWIYRSVTLGVRWPQARTQRTGH